MATKIVVQNRIQEGYSYIAFVEGSPEIFARGQDHEEAIGRLLMMNPNVFGVEIQKD